ncbi:peptidase M23-like protein [Hydrogenoanaerobacterium saccharovorans]|uniref:Peptidase family M23 n=1 Tax=Hydrogenoanaerobacterium saccharovorans TaxID=474960 RepID=A0A1H8CNG0_9FIRM|nr:M23 family metallopeptidase [Hydrogenoanaerobacterium saccharovorans]RPF43221.1 peptidase M23-like protein [Hydrogenoanaerobacterium saccharovorans]SEM96452.1 Peptidase family M23 [Hydrogenoanaerobacterium saccharovorans]
MKSNKGRLANFLNGKGFYAALALCLVGAGTAAWVVVDKTLGSITGTPSSSSSQSSIVSEESSWGFPELEEAGTPKPNVEVSSGSSSSEQTASSSSEAQPAAGEVYEQQMLSLEQQTSAFALPIKSAEVFNQYSNGELVKNTTLDKWCTHDGIDMKAAKGTDVLCVADGKVSRVYDNGIWGKTVEVSHENKLVSIYSGLAKDVAVKEGDAITIAQPIGKVGDTNLAEAKLESHLHFAMKQDGKFVDPLKTMGKLK